MARKKGVRLDPFARPPSEISPLTEFVISCGDEVTELEAIREYQEEWCEHPSWSAVVTDYRPLSDNFSHLRKCDECGKVEWRKGRASVAA